MSNRSLKNPIDRRELLAGFLAAAPAAAALAQTVDTPRDFLHEAKADRDQRLKWWRDARFGMFIHWGVYSVPAGIYQGREIPGIGEWIQAGAGIPGEEYAKFPPQFNPVLFDADEWVRTAKDAGMRYLVITSKHHDGFAMFNSKGTDWDIVDATPFKRDPLKELSRACRRHGLKFCTYYSIMDWHHPSQERNMQATTTRGTFSPNLMKAGRKEEYVQFMKAQLAEIVHNYDPAVLWFDGEWVKWWTAEDGRNLYNYLRTLKPSLIINNRIGKARGGMQGISKGEGDVGDFGTPEQQIPPSGIPGVDWESCMTMNDTWGFKSRDENWKSTTVLVRNLIDIASKGGNFLLNVGPTSQGQIPAPSVHRLHEMGRWTHENSESIYGTTASPFPEKLPWGRATARPGKIYLHVFDWPKDGGLTVRGVPGPVRRAYALADRSEALRVQQSGPDTVVSLPGLPLDPIASVIVLETRSEKSKA